jgi:hypothetical protein
VRSLQDLDGLAVRNRHRPSPVPCEDKKNSDRPASRGGSHPSAAPSVSRLRPPQGDPDHGPQARTSITDATR